MNNFHIYEEVGRGKDSVVYKVSDTIKTFANSILNIGSQEENSRVCGCQVSREVPTPQSA